VNKIGHHAMKPTAAAMSNYGLLLHSSFRIAAQRRVRNP
jgi:hypothetical protein